MGGLFIKSKTSGVPEKYTKLRPEIKNGDLILYQGTSFLAKGILYFDSAYYNHIGIIWKPDNTERVLTLDMWSGGIACLPLSRRMDGYRDFCILRPKTTDKKKKAALSLLLNEWDGRNILYNTLLIFRIALIKKTGIDITGLSKKGEFICSGLAQHYCDLLGIKTYSNINLITPEDFRRFIDENFELLHDEKPAPNMSRVGKEIWHLGGDNYKL